VRDTPIHAFIPRPNGLRVGADNGNRAPPFQLFAAARIDEDVVAPALGEVDVCGQSDFPFQVMASIPYYVRVIIQS
jgi:hypothetical protein